MGLFTSLFSIDRGGIRDAELTNHGFQQAFRLGEYLRSEGITVKHILSSTLSRAVRTSEQILQGQGQQIGNLKSALDLTPLLVEQDFGSLEGVPWANKESKKLPTRSRTGGDRGCYPVASKGEITSSYVPKESQRSLENRADSFVDLHLMPTLKDASRFEDSVTMVVSHGIMLKYIFRQFALRLPTKPLFIGSMSECNVVYSQSMEDLLHWSNTGYLELHFHRSGSLQTQEFHASMVKSRGGPRRIETHLTSSQTKSLISTTDEEKFCDLYRVRPDIEVNKDEANMLSKVTPDNGKDFPNLWKTLIVTVNGTLHLRSLKRTGGGIGSAKYDKRQTTLHRFLNH